MENFQELGFITIEDKNTGEKITAMVPKQNVEQLAGLTN